MKKNQLFCLILAVSLLLCCFAGCGTTTASSGEQSQIQEQASQETQEIQEPEVQQPQMEEASLAEMSTLENDGVVMAKELDMDYQVELPICQETKTFSLWTGIAPFAVNQIENADDMTLYQELENRTGIAFDATIVNGAEEETQFNLMVAAGDYTNIIIGMGYYSTGISGALNDDIIVDLLDYVQDYAPHYYDYISAEPTAMATLLTDDGKMGTIATTYQELGLENQGLAIRGDWLKEFGMEVPETYDELYAYAKKANEVYGSTLSFPTNANSTSLSMGFGVLAGEYTTFDGVVEYYIQREGYYDYLSTMAQWFAEGLIYPDFFSLTDNTANGDLFCNGTTSMNEVGASVMHSLYEKVDTSYGAEFVAMPNPVTEKGAALPCSAEVSFINDSDAWAITTSCNTDDIPDLMKLVDYMYSDEGALLWNYGLEGDTFNYVDGKPTFTEKITAPADGMMSAVAQYAYCTVNVPSRNDMRKGFYSFDQTAWDALDLYAQQLDGSNCYPQAAVEGLTTEETEAYAAVSSDVETYVEAEILRFVTGAVALTPESYQSFVDTAVGMGLDEMVEIYQNAYDRYLDKVS